MRSARNARPDCPAARTESARLARPRILIELDQAVPLSTLSQYQLVSRLPQLGFTDAHRIALVRRTAQMRRANEFINTVAAKIWLRAA